MTVTSQRSAGSRTSRFFLLAGLLVGITGLLSYGTHATAQDPGTDITTPAAAENTADDGVGGGAEVEQRVSEMASWVDDWFPLWLDKEHFGLRDAQWLCLLILVFLGIAADRATRFVLSVLGRIAFRASFDEMEPRERRKVFKPVGLLAQALTWFWGTALVGLPENILVIFEVAVKFFTVVAAIWTSFILIDMVVRYLKKKAEGTETKFDDLLLPLVGKTLKVFAVCIGMIVFADVFELKVTALLGGLGLGGMALALASQDALSNIFGSFLVMVDRPFEIGDWIIFEDHEGAVESMGIRSTRIRTFYDSQVTVPNSKFTSAIVDNMGRRKFRRLRTTLGLEYDSTPDQIVAFCEGVRELIRQHPNTRKDLYHVYFNNFGDNSLDVLLLCFMECSDYASELKERQSLFLGIMQLADRLGVSFAFPTRTIHIFQQDASAASPPSFEDPLETGRQLATEIAAPLLVELEKLNEDDETLPDDEDE
jgi:MscS family membrane protein